MVWSRIGGKGACNIPTAYSCLHLQEFLLLGSKACIGKIFLVMNAICTHVVSVHW